MTTRFALGVMTLATAIAVAAAEYATIVSHRLPGWAAIPLVFVTAATVIWAALALDALLRRTSRPDRADIQAVAEDQRLNRDLIDRNDRRLDQIGRLLRLTAATAELDRLDNALAVSAAAIEQWDAIDHHLPYWSAALDDWAAIARSIAPDIAPDRGPVTPAEARQARDRLPPDRNFSSRALRDAVAYVAHRDRLTSARVRLESTRAALIAALPPIED